MEEKTKQDKSERKKLQACGGGRSDKKGDNGETKSTGYKEAAIIVTYLEVSAAREGV